MTYDVRSKELKGAEEQNRVLRKLLCDKEVELEIQRELFKKKVGDIRSKKDLVDLMYNKHNISKAKLIDMVGMVHSSYYRKPSEGRKGNKPSKFTYHNKKGLVTQDSVIKSVKCILNHPFIDCGYRLMTSYLKRDGFTINHKKLYRIMKEGNLLKLDDRIDRSGSGRKFVKFRKVKTARHFECLEMDIKMVGFPVLAKTPIYYLL